MVEVKELKLNDTFRIANHNWVNLRSPKGTVVKVVAISGGIITVNNPAYGSFSVGSQDLNYLIMTKAYVATQLKASKEALDYYKEAAEYMKENELDSFDEEQFKVYQVIKTIDDKASYIDKARLIAKMMKES